MAIISHWTSITEANKLTQSRLLAGVVQELYERVEMLARFPVFSVDSISTRWNREDTLPAAEPYSEGVQLGWRADVGYQAITEFFVKHYYAQRVLDNIRAQQYKNPNDYKTQLMLEMTKGLGRTIEDKLFYASATNSPLDFDGLLQLPTLNAVDATRNMAFDGNEVALSLTALKRFIRQVKPAPDVLIMPWVLTDRISWAGQFGITTGAANAWVQQGLISRTVDDLGKSILRFDGIPILPSDFMVAEEHNTGPAFGNVRIKNVGAPLVYSILAIRFGQIEDGGVCLMIPEGAGGADNLFKLTEFEKLENYDAAGIRLTAHLCPANGSTRAIGCYYDVTDAAVTL